MSEVSTEPIVGWRLWHVRLHGTEYRLESFTWHHVSWPPKRRFEASCTLHRDAAPVDDHECGIYAFRTRALAEDLLRRYTGIRQCYGREYRELPPVRGRDAQSPSAGGFTLGQDLGPGEGLPGQYAYPYELHLIGGDDRIARELRDCYAVDVVRA